jgi:hypothetical protein
MSFGAKFLNLMNAIATVEPRTGTTGNGAPAYGALTYHRAYVDETGTLFRNAQGQQVVDSATIYLFPVECNADGTDKTGATTLTAIPTTSRIGIPDPTVAGGVAHPTILKVDGLHDRDGIQMFVLHT